MAALEKRAAQLASGTADLLINRPGLVANALKMITHPRDLGKRTLDIAVERFLATDRDIKHFSAADSNDEQHLINILPDMKIPAMDGPAVNDLYLKFKSYLALQAELRNRC